MKVTLNMEHVQSNVGNNGVVLEIANDEGLLGKLRVGRAKVEWRKRNLRESTPGIELTLRELIDIFESRQGSAVKPVRSTQRASGRRTGSPAGAARRKPGSTADTTRRKSGPQVPDARTTKRGAPRVSDGQEQLFNE